MRTDRVLGLSIHLVHARYDAIGDRSPRWVDDLDDDGGMVFDGKDEVFQ